MEVVSLVVGVDRAMATVAPDDREVGERLRCIVRSLCHRPSPSRPNAADDAPGKPRSGLPGQFGALVSR